MGLISFFKKMNFQTKGDTQQTEIYAQDLDEEDPWIKRIRKSGCFKEHESLQDCFFDKKDWRHCRDEMMAFKACFAHHSNATHLKDS